MCVQVVLKGMSTRSHVAVILQEEYNLRYGPDLDLTKSYHIYQLMFTTGVNSSAGHFTSAVRLQSDGAYRPGDLWQYLDSDHVIQTRSLHQLCYEQAHNVYVMQMMAKVEPQGDPRPLLKAARYCTPPFLNLSLLAIASKAGFACIAIKMTALALVCSCFTSCSAVRMQHAFIDVNPVTICAMPSKQSFLWSSGTRLFMLFC